MALICFGLWLILIEVLSVFVVLLHLRWTIFFLILHLPHTSNKQLTYDCHDKLTMTPVENTLGLNDLYHCRHLNFEELYELPYVN